MTLAIEPSPPPEFGQKEKIQILLSEYSTLRSEILSRTNHGFQITGISVALIGLLLQKKEIDVGFWIELGILLLGSSALLLITFILIGRAARRIQTLEQDINERADEKLLVWETVYGEAHGIERSGVFGFFVDSAERFEILLRKIVRKAMT
jgi:hypothetical protein